MIYHIDERVCEKYNLNLSEVLAMMLVKSCESLQDLTTSLIQKGAIVEQDGKYLVTTGYDDRVNSVLLDSEANAPSEERLENLAAKMNELFPKLKKTKNAYFRGNKTDLTLKLKKFFKRYGSYSDEEILNATKRYVESFNGDYTFMRILKHFIWKDEKKIDGEGKGYVEEVSDLATWIENADAVDSSDDTWLVKAR